MYQEPADVDLKKPIDKCQTINSSSESYTTEKLKPFEFIELIQEMESYVMIPTRLKDIEVGIETMPRFLAAEYVSESYREELLNMLANHTGKNC